MLTLILQSGVTDDNLVGQIRESAKHFEGQASQHRLNQNEPKGPQMLRAAKVKENETALKQQCKAEIFKMEASIVIYPVGSAVCKKVPGTELADTALDGLLNDLHHRYSSLPGPRTLDSSPSFERCISFCVLNIDV